MMKMKKNEIITERAITLISLVITIIVLLILAGVTISTLTGQNGILTQATKAQLENRAGKVEEEVNLWKTQVNSQQYVTADVEDENSLLARLKKDNSVFEDEIDLANKTITIGDRVISYDIEYPEGKLRLEYEIEDNILYLIPKIGGYTSYKEYAKNILKGKSNEEKITIFLEGESKKAGIDFENLTNWIEKFNAESSSNITEENFESDIIRKANEWGGSCSNFDDVLIYWEDVKYDEYTDKNSKYENYHVTIKENNISIGSYIQIEGTCPTVVKSGTHTYTAYMEEDDQEASVTVTFNKKDLPRYVIELNTAYKFCVYDNQEEKYMTFTIAQLSLKQNGVEVFNEDVTSNVNRYGQDINYSKIYMRPELEYKEDLNLYQKAEAKLIFDGIEVQNMVCMSHWIE